MDREKKELTGHRVPSFQVRELKFSPKEIFFQLFLQSESSLTILEALDIDIDIVPSESHPVVCIATWTRCK